MSELALPLVTLPAMSDEAVANVRALESLLLQCEQEPMPTHHLIHAGLYARTICLRAGVMLTGALIKLATVLVVHGDATAYIGGQSVRLTGYHVMPASAGRKQAFFAHADTHITMLFPTDVQTVQQAEQEFTDEYERLMTYQQAYQGDEITITGE